MSIDHRAEALRLATESHGVFRSSDEGPCEADRLLTQALVHATLARDEEQAAATADLRDVIALLRRRSYAMRNVISTHIAEALASREPDRWKSGMDLSRALDEADCNVDGLVDTWLSDHEWDPRSAYKAPDTGGGWAWASVPDPWAPTPDITAAIPEPVRRVIAGHIAEALIDSRDSEIQKWARGITFELKHVGADLTGDIEKRITELTLGADPSESPF